MAMVLTRFPVLTALLAQGVAFAVVYVLAPLLPGLGLGWWLVEGLVAGAITVALLRSPWWWVIQITFPWFVLLGLGAQVPSWAWGVALLACLVVFGGGILTRVPLYLSNTSAWEALAGLAKPDGRAVDLGAGFGGPMRALARAHPAGRYRSVEASPVTALICWLLAVPYRRVSVRWGSLWNCPLGDQDLVYVFLSPAPMERLWTKAKAEMRPGSLLVSNTFPVPGVDPAQVIPLDGRADARLFVYRM